MSGAASRSTTAGGPESLAAPPPKHKMSPLPRRSGISTRSVDGQFNHAHLHSTKHLEFLDQWGKDKLPDDDIAVPLKYQPPSSDDGDDVNILAEQLETAKKWNDLALDFLNDDDHDPQRPPNSTGQNYPYHQQYPQQIH